jgi:integrase
MNIAEICGLRWKRVNLTDEWLTSSDGEALAPRTIAVREHWYRDRLTQVTQKSRRRNLAIPAPLFPTLLRLRQRASHSGPEDFVLVSRAGSPINERNIATRRLKSIGRQLEMPWLSWQVFRRTHTTLGYEVGMQFLGDRVAKAGV